MAGEWQIGTNPRELQVHFHQPDPFPAPLPWVASAPWERFLGRKSGEGTRSASGELGFHPDFCRIRCRQRSPFSHL